MTGLREAISVGLDPASPDHWLLLTEFARDQLRTLDGLTAIGYPIGYVRIALDPNDMTEAVFLTRETAESIHRALGVALGEAES
jgi:hypothetical protein